MFNIVLVHNPESTNRKMELAPRIVKGLAMDWYFFMSVTHIINARITIAIPAVNKT